MSNRFQNWILIAPALATPLLLTTSACTPRANSPHVETDSPSFQLNLPPANAITPLVKIDPPKPLPANIVAAWKEIRAEVGWLRVRPNGCLEFIQENGGGPGDLPAFRLARWEEGHLSKLPVPSSGFGLYLTSAPLMTPRQKAGSFGVKPIMPEDVNTQVTDAGLKELAGLKSLESLKLGSTQITDAGLKELAGLTSLRSLDLSFTIVLTDRGLKELTGLTSLQSLAVGSTKVTDGGLKELTGLTRLQSLNLFLTAVTDAGLKELAPAYGVCDHSTLA